MAIGNLFQVGAPTSQGFERGRPGAKRTEGGLFILIKQVGKEPPDRGH